MCFMLNKILSSSSFNRVLCRLLVISKPYNANKMFVSRGIPKFTELVCNFIYKFAQVIEPGPYSFIKVCSLLLTHVRDSHEFD